MSITEEPIFCFSYIFNFFLNILNASYIQPVLYLKSWSLTLLSVASAGFRSRLVIWVWDKCSWLGFTYRSPGLNLQVHPPQRTCIWH